MKITVIAVGRIKEKYLKDAIDEYSKRLSKYVNLEIIEIPDEKAPETLSTAQEIKVKDEEGQKILKNIKDGVIVALAIEGKQMKSTEFAGFFQKNMVSGASHITFVIGGSLGLSDSVINNADFKISFSKMTFPHQLMRVILLEQVFRAFKIIKNEPYHK